jgi:hypothetical protein
MEREGPPLPALTRRLAECPADFTAEPRIGAAGQVQVAAVVADLLRDLGGPLITPAQRDALSPTDAKRYRNWLQLVLVVAWLLHDDWFTAQGNFGAAAGEFITGGLAQLAALTTAGSFINDPDRREELARLALRDLGLRPAGETAAQAQDRLSTLSTVERQRVLAAAQKAEERARAVREAMAKQAAEEAAAQYSRE